MTIKDCVPSDEWQWEECDLPGHEGECKRLVCPSCGDVMNRECEDKL